MNAKPRAAFLSSRLDWIIFQILILFILTIVYTVIIWRVEAPNAQTMLDTFRVVVKEVVPFSQYALLCILGVFELGGTLMLLYFHKIEQAAKQGIEQGIEQGRSETYREWSDWNTRRQEAEAKGIPFNEPPPPNPNGAKKES